MSNVPNHGAWGHVAGTCPLHEECSSSLYGRKALGQKLILLGNLQITIKEIVFNIYHI